jgi:hypothetical protein
MSKFIPKIGWIKWKNPYSVDNNSDNDNWDTRTNENSFLHTEEEEEPESIQYNPVKIVMTPMGAIPLPEHSAPQKVFNLWTAHTNFNITKNILNLVENTEGVETVDVFTRYRMRIGIGQMFDTQTTIRNINNNLYAIFITPTTSGTYGET